jgi:hypothetical protein
MSEMLDHIRILEQRLVDNDKRSRKEHSKELKKLRKQLSRRAESTVDRAIA